MKLAIRAYVVTLILLTLAFTVTAQQRSADDPRNTAPTVGTGGPVGGPTGLFTVYDGQTLRKGEYTFSVALSNYDRDPGDVDITSVPLSFQVGVTSNLELFFTTEGYRGVHVNAPRNLSSFYLPNSQFFVNGALQSLPAIVLAPSGPGPNPFFGQAVFRPTGTQPFVNYPFGGGNAGTFGLQFPFFSGPQFGFPAGTNALLGSPIGGGAAAAYPGIGSVYGSILPGIVLTTGALVDPAGNPGGEGPLVFTTAPSYLPDAPFISRTWGTSSFNSMDFGFKWRINNPEQPIGYGIIASYRWYLDQADSFSGFNMLQRGAGPGANKGDVNVTVFTDARLSKRINMSGNVGYTYTTNPKDAAGFTMLDRPDELMGSIGVDFPVNKYFQPILEFRTLHYVGGHTPQAFERNPIDGLAGVRIYPRRWFGFGLAYRANLNQQNNHSFGDDSHTSNVIFPCRIGVPNCQPLTVSNSFTGAPRGFQTSTNPSGYIAQFWIGSRHPRAEAILNKPADVTAVSLSATVIRLPCAPGRRSTSGQCADAGSINVATTAVDPENDVLTYNYTVSGGRIVGTGANVQWDLAGVQPGTYTITTGVNDGCGICGRTDTQTIRVEECPDCVVPCSCPSLSISVPTGITNPGDAMTFVATVDRPDVTYNWTVTNGTIESGQGTSSITVRTTSEMAGSNVTATVEIGGFPDCSCPKTASETAPVAARPEGQVIDTFGPQKADEIKARVDNFFIALNNSPGSEGYVINYGTPAQVKATEAQIRKAIAFRKYDISRIHFVQGPDTGEGISTKFILVPPGATPPTP